jgi:hypothetical protein
MAKGCLGQLLQWFTGNEDNVGFGHAMPEICLNKRFVSDAEANFFQVLRAVVGARGHVLAQVSLGQLFWLPGNNRGTPGRAAWQNKLRGRTVDFVICDPGTLRPLVAVELDEPSHAAARRQTRDEEVAAALDAAGLPLVRLITSRAYDTRELEAGIAAHLK